MPLDPHPPDLDPQETREWLSALEAVFRNDGGERAAFLIDRLRERIQSKGVRLAYDHTSPYVNTISRLDQPPYPGDLDLERRLTALLRWNAAVTVIRANKEREGVGGHIATYQGIADLFEVGLNHFWRARNPEREADLVFFQGHASPGIYARMFLEGRLDEENLRRFRNDLHPKGLTSYPHAWLMPDVWQFATVSMGLGPLMAIYQARFLKYLAARGMTEAADRKVWAFLGDGEMDEPESLGALTMAGREELDNLVFVVNCNLQRLDGPVRGNGKIVQELESVFRGANWHTVKLLWGSEWDEMLERDERGLLRQRMHEIVDGEWQSFTVRGGAALRERVFGGDPELEKLAAHLSDQELEQLSRGGHDRHKIHAAFQRAVNHRGQPSVVFAQTVKGYGMGSSGEGLNTAHQTKKMDIEGLRVFRERFGIPISDAGMERLDFLHPEPDAPEMVYLRQRREDLGGAFPSRRTESRRLEVPELEAFQRLLKGSGEREQSTTMGFVQALAVLLRDKTLKERIVPILADEARTFGMEGLFRQLGIYSPRGQMYEPVDAGQLAPYKEAVDGQILQEGINEAGAVASWIAAGMSYSTHDLPMIPFYIFYSMFGFQRIGDLVWAAADMRARGFLIGGTAGRTTLNGEGLQHEDGHSHLVASTIPNCVAYDPAYNYELAVIVQDGLRRMVAEAEDVFYYVTVMNENYRHGEMPEGVAGGIRKGMYLLREAEKTLEQRPLVQLLGAGTILREVEAAAKILDEDFGVDADIWSVTSFSELRRDGLDVDRWNLLHPTATPRTSWVSDCLQGRRGPVVASTDYMKTVADQIRPWIAGTYRVLGTDGFGRSDTREGLRDFFEVDRRWVTLAALSALAETGSVSKSVVEEALRRLEIDPERPNPLGVGPASPVEGKPTATVASTEIASAEIKAEAAPELGPDLPSLESESLSPGPVSTPAETSEQDVFPTALHLDQSPPPPTETKDAETEESESENSDSKESEKPEDVPLEGASPGAAIIEEPVIEVPAPAERVADEATTEEKTIEEESSGASEPAEVPEMPKAETTPEAPTPSPEPRPEPAPTSPGRSFLGFDRPTPPAPQPMAEEVLPSLEPEELIPVEPAASDAPAWPPPKPGSLPTSDPTKTPTPPTPTPPKTTEEE